MKILGQLLVWASLAGGALAAATGYLASLDTADERLLDLTLAAPAGRVERADGTLEPIVKIDPKEEQKVSAELLAELRHAGVRNVRVKQFSLWRWRGKWFFLLSLVGLLIGGLLTRLRLRPEAATQTDRSRADSPARTMEAMQSEIEQLRSQLPEMPDRSARLNAIVDRIGRLQMTHMAAFVDARPRLISLLGLAGYAALMDSYAAAERQINRAWSAAVDKAYEEATACLAEASALIEQTRRKLPAARGAQALDCDSTGDRITDNHDDGTDRKA